MPRVKPSPSKSEPAQPERRFPVGVGIALVAVAALIWFMQSEANNMELERELRKLPGGDVWLTESIGWVEEGRQDDGRSVWLVKVDELVRTNPEVGASELLALKVYDAVRIKGRGEKRAAKLYVSARGFGFVGRGMDEPLSGHRWMVATFENEHGQRQLFDALPAPVLVAARTEGEPPE